MVLWWLGDKWIYHTCLQNTKFSIGLVLLYLQNLDDCHLGFLLVCQTHETFAHPNVSKTGMGVRCQLGFRYQEGAGPGCRWLWPWWCYTGIAMESYRLRDSKFTEGNKHKDFPGPMLINFLSFHGFVKNWAELVFLHKFRLLRERTSRKQLSV